MAPRQSTIFLSSYIHHADAFGIGIYSHLFNLNNIIKHHFAKQVVSFKYVGNEGIYDLQYLDGDKGTMILPAPECDVLDFSICFPSVFVSFLVKYEYCFRANLCLI